MCVVVWYLAVGEGCLSVFTQITRIGRYLLTKVHEEAVGDDRANAPGRESACRVKCMYWKSNLADNASCEQRQVTSSSSLLLTSSCSRCLSHQSAHTFGRLSVLLLWHTSELSTQVARPSKSSGNKASASAVSKLTLSGRVDECLIPIVDMSTFSCAQTCADLLSFHSTKQTSCVGNLTQSFKVLTASPRTAYTSYTGRQKNHCIFFILKCNLQSMEKSFPSLSQPNPKKKANANHRPTQPTIKPHSNDNAPPHPPPQPLPPPIHHLPRSTPKCTHQASNVQHGPRSNPRLPSRPRQARQPHSPSRLAALRQHRLAVRAPKEKRPAHQHQKVEEGVPAEYVYGFFESLRWDRTLPSFGSLP